VIDANQTGNGSYLDAPQAQQTIAVAAAPSSAVQIDQLRLSGPGGAGDQFVELYNSSSAAVPVGDWRLVGSNGAATRLGASASIPADGHLLFTGSGYTLGSVAAGDASLPAGIPADGGVKLLAGSTVIDAVGFAGAPAGYFTGTGLPIPATLPTDDFAWVKRYADGAPVNTSDNAADFAFVAVNASDASASGSELGAPGPSDLNSPVVHNDVLQSSLLDPGVSESASPNQIYTAGSDGDAGTLIINRVLTNCSGQVPAANTPCANNPVGTSPMSVTRLRFRITGLTTVGSPGAGSSQAVLEAQNSNGESNLSLSAGGSASPLGLALDSPSVSGSGGLNATWTATSLLPQGGLAAGASIDVEFEFAVAQTGSFSFAYNSEDDLVPESASGGGSTDTGSGTASLPATPPISARLTGTVGTKSTTPARVPTVCRATLGSLQARPGIVRRGHRVRLRLRLSQRCSHTSTVTISSKAFAAHRRPARSVHVKIRERELTLTVMVPATRQPGRYAIVARASGSRSFRISVDVSR
jgi:hypothetical protein